ncbi:hypothetical protein SLI_4158 [Streptomyces lividans 1326]|uniref:Uncharacterized protein n=1 Tax=Streptomyces lividans 1326 TaxID=1200984 RepID=A0A7U9DRN2_STRLI|nr:hypothetical protein SLI_4158 [Streptomyces lividans 1326]
MARVVDHALLAGRRGPAPPGPCRTAGRPSPAAAARLGRSATAAPVPLCRAPGLGAAPVRTLLVLRTVRAGRRPCGASRCRTAAGGRTGLTASGRGTSASLRRRRFATVLAHRTTTPRAGAPLRAW